MTDRRVLVTGATGHLGTAVLQALGREGTRCIAVARHAGAPRPGVTWHEASVEDPAAMRELIPEGGVVLHLAGVSRGAAPEIHRSFVEGARSVLAAAAQRRARVVVASSLSVLPAIPGPATIDGSGPAEPDPSARGPYTIAKTAAEHLAMAAAAAGQDVVIVRPAQLVGGTLAAVPPSVAIGVGPLLVMVGRPTTVLPVVHVVDAALGFLAAARHAKAGAIWPLVDPAPVTRRALLTALRRHGVPGADRPLVRMPRLGIALVGVIPGRAARNLYHRVGSQDPRITWQVARHVGGHWAPSHLQGWLGGEPTAGS